MMASVLHHPMCNNLHAAFRTNSSSSSATSDAVFYKPRRRSSSSASSLDGTEECSSVSSDSGGSEPSSPTHRGLSPSTSARGVMMMMLGGSSGRDLMAMSRRRSAQDIRRHYASKLGIVHSHQAEPVPASRRVSCLPEGYEPAIEKLKGGQAECYGGFLKLMRRSSRVGSSSMKEDNRTTNQGAGGAATVLGGPSWAGAQEGEGKGLSTERVAAAGVSGCASYDGETRGRCTTTTATTMTTTTTSPAVCSACMSGTAKGGCSEGHEGVTTVRKGGLKRGPSTKGGAGPKRGISFVEAVKVVHIPSHEDYSRRVRDQYWSSADDIYESACRNLIEFEFEGNCYEQAVEEQDMILCESGELVHPAHFDFAAMTAPIM